MSNALQEHREGLEPSSPHYECGVLAAKRPVPFYIQWDRFLTTSAFSFLFSGIGGYRTHIVRFKKPVHYLVCHNPSTIGAEGVEPSTCVL